VPTSTSYIPSKEGSHLFEEKQAIETKMQIYCQQ